MNLVDPVRRNRSDRRNASPTKGAAAPGRPSAGRLSAEDVRLSIGARLRREREALGMSLEEVARATRIPTASLERVEADRFDDLPGEVFVRGFLRAYAKTVGLDPDDVLAAYGSARRVPYVAPVPLAPGAVAREGRRVGIAIAFVLLLVLCTMALSFVLKPRGRDQPSEVSKADVGLSQLVHLG
jgi:hypothetical protein